MLKSEVPLKLGKLGSVQAISSQPYKPIVCTLGKGEPLCERRLAASGFAQKDKDRICFQLVLHLFHRLSTEKRNSSTGVATYRLYAIRGQPSDDFPIMSIVRVIAKHKLKQKLSEEFAETQRTSTPARVRPNRDQRLPELACLRWTTALENILA
jgi:hypothetical protein